MMLGLGRSRQELAPLERSQRSGILQGGRVRFPISAAYRGRALNVCFGSILLKNSEIRGRQKSDRMMFRARIAVQCRLNSSAVVSLWLSVNLCIPQVLFRLSGPRPCRIVIIEEKRVFQQHRSILVIAGRSLLAITGACRVEIRPR